MSVHTNAESPELTSKADNSSAGNHSDAIIKEDPIAEVLEHDTMVFFAVLLMLCKVFWFYNKILKTKTVTIYKNV